MQKKIGGRPGEKERTSKQWAWEFLRRNEKYGQSLKFLLALTKEQRAVVVLFLRGEIEFSADYVDATASLPLRLFDCSYLDGYKPTHVCLGDYLPDRIMLGEEKLPKKPTLLDQLDGLHLVINPEFRLDTYGLRFWVDPLIREFTSEEAEALWEYQIPIKFALTRMPTFDAAYAGDKDWSDEGNSTVKISTVKKQNRHKPGEFSYTPGRLGGLPLLRGKNGAIFLENMTQDEMEDLLPLKGNSTASASFDLTFPINYQIEALREALEAHQQELINAGFIDEQPSRIGRNGVFSNYLKILDLEKQGKTNLEIAIETKGLKAGGYVDAQGVLQRSFTDPKSLDDLTAQQSTADIRKQLERARRLRDFGFRSLALQTD